jgi:DNA-binding CsgD family transcriptional regulator
MFAHRPLTAGDLDRVFSLLREGFAFERSDRARLVAMWTALLESEACLTVGVDDRRRPPETRLVGFGLSVFATDAFAERLDRGQPLLSRAFLEQWESGPRPYLTKKEIAAANAGDGLNLLILHYGWCEHVTPEDMTTLQHLQTERFIQQHAGYLTKEYLHEFFGPQLRDFMLAAGLVLKHDSRGETWRDALAGVAEEDWPYLAVHGAEPSRPGTITSIFRSKAARPRFGLSPGEQRLIELALEGRSDDELAAALSLSPWTVKKRWQRIYGKVETHEPSLFASEGDKLRQRRRYLLAFMREHPEELRPFRGSTPKGV